MNDVIITGRRSTNSQQETTVSESDNQAPERAAASPASQPDDLVKDLEMQVSDEDQSNVQGGAVDVFLKLGDVKGESRLR
jgi:hypothetical protein